MHTNCFGRPEYWTVFNLHLGKGKGVSMKLAGILSAIPHTGVSKGN